jgi:hypothetical protein
MSYQIDLLCELDEAQINVCNLWNKRSSETGFLVRPDDYEEKLNECNTKHWIDLFHKEYENL